MQSKYVFYAIAFLLFFLQLAVSGLVYKLLKYINIFPVLVLDLILSFLPFGIVLYVIYKEPPKIKKPLDSKSIEEVIKDNIWVFYFLPLSILFLTLYLRGDIYRFVKWIIGFFTSNPDESIIAWHLSEIIDFSVFILFFSVLGVINYLKSSKYSLSSASSDKKRNIIAIVVFFLYVMAKWK